MLMRLAVAYWLLFPSLCMAAPTNSDSISQTRVLHFNSPRSCGQILTIKKGNSLTDKHVMGEALADAKGDVVVPKNAHLMLNTSYEVVEHPEVLNTLPADAFECIVFTQVPVENSIFKPLARFVPLKRLELDGAEVDDSGVAQIGSLKNLSALSLTYCNLNGHCLPALGSMTKLEYLMASRNPFDWKFLREHFPLLPAVKVIVLNKTGMDNESLAILEKLPNLTNGNFGITKGIDDRCVPYILKSKSMVSLSLTGTRITAKGVDELLAKSKLKLITVSAASLNEADKIRLSKSPRIHLVQDKGNPETFELYAPLH